MGNFGSAVQHLLSSVHAQDLSMWDNDTTKVPDQASLKETLRGASIVFLCVSSWSLREAALATVPHMQDDAIVVCPTKGIEQESLLTSDELLQEIYSDRASVTLLHGPMLAAEILQNLPAFSVLAAPSQEVFNRVRTVFAGSNLHLEYSNDVHGVALAGVLKNIYSIGLGVTSALDLGSNFRGWYVRKAISEMQHIITGLGGNSETAFTDAGIADMIATGFSPYSRNCKVGHEIVQSGECVTVSEGAESLPQMVGILERESLDAPIVSVIAKIVSGTAPAQAIDTIIRPPV